MQLTNTFQAVVNPFRISAGRPCECEGNIAHMRGFISQSDILAMKKSDYSRHPYSHCTRPETKTVSEQKRTGTAADPHVHQAMCMYFMPRGVVIYIAKREIMITCRYNCISPNNILRHTHASKLGRLCEIKSAVQRSQSNIQKNQRKTPQCTC